MYKIFPLFSTAYRLISFRGRPTKSLLIFVLISETSLNCRLIFFIKCVAYNGDVIIRAVLRSFHVELLRGARCVPEFFISNVHLAIQEFIPFQLAIHFVNDS